MVKLVDVNGNPIETGKPRESQTARVAHLHHEFAGHPSRGLTPTRLARILESAEQGDIRAQHDLFLDMEEKDGHIFAEMSKRKRALLTGQWDIAPPRNASAREKKTAAAVKELLSDIANLEDVLLDCLDAFGWITHVHKAKSGYLSRAGLHRVLAWPFLFKNYSVRDLAEFLEIYGLPLRLGTYPSGSGDDEKATLLRAVMQIGHDAAGIIPEGMSIDFKEAAKGSHDPYQAMMDWCERTQSKTILGGTLTTQADGKSSTNALGNVHNEVRHDLMMSDSLQLCGTLTRDLVVPMLVLNIGAVEDMRRIPRFTIDLRESEDLGLYAEALPKLVDVGLPVPVSWAQDKLRIPIPEKDEPVLARSMPSNSENVPPAAATGIVAAAAQNGRDEFDLFSDELASDWERVTDPLIAPILALAASADNLEDFQARLPGLIESMSVEQLAETLAQGQFAAAIYGRVRNQKR